MFSNLRSLIFKLDPETAHNLAIKSLKFNFVPNVLEEDRNNPLLSNKRVFLSPHAATFTKECLENMSIETVTNIIDFFEKRIDKSKIVTL